MMKMKNATTTRRQSIAIALGLIIGLTALALGFSGAFGSVSDIPNSAIVSVNR
jgi:hypothetical protein